MARYILIDSNSGYIFCDSADLNGTIFDGTPIEFARAFDESIGEVRDDYEMLISAEIPYRVTVDSGTGYYVYRADVRGSEAVGVVQNGQDQETIAAVIRDCEFVGFVRPVTIDRGE